ncbi:MAG: hypothetical protein ACFE9L_09045 [Candidatus Hodarchaeota archaeon]
MTSQLYYRIGVPAERTLFENQRDLFNGFVIKANLTTLYRDWTTSFIRKLKKPYFIDPVTYLFSLGLEFISQRRGKIKKSYTKLLDYYSNEVKEILIQEGRELFPSDFLDNTEWKEDMISNFVQNVINLQKQVGRFQQQQTLIEILEIIGEDTNAEIPTLEFLIPPYFYFESSDDPWYRINLKLAEVATTYKENHDLFPLLCISKSILFEPESIERLIQDYRSFDGIVLWVSDFNELEEDRRHLGAYSEFLQRFSIKPTIVLYGGYFTSLLSKQYLTGYVRNIGYGEHRSVYAPPSGGPVPQRNFYLRSTHTKVSETKIRTLYSMFPEIRCQCGLCSSVGIQDPDEFFSTMSMNDYKAHFMFVHSIEHALSFEDQLARLNEELENCNNFNLADLNIKYQHLIRWKEVIENNI